MNELLEDLKNEIESCRMSTAGGNNINVDGALNTLKELEKAITVTQCCTELCDCEIPKPIDAYHPEYKNICRDCKCKIA